MELARHQDFLPQRIHHLDALRGIAALIVAFYHSLRPFAERPRDTGWTAVMDGHTAVLFFFILSGFVLGRSLSEAPKLGWVEITSYWIKRFFRLYPLTACAVLFAALCAHFYSLSDNWAKVAPWVAKMMELSKNLSGFREYASCLALHVSYLNAPLWTIKVELVCSVLLPFLVLLMLRSRDQIVMAGVLCILLVVYYRNTPTAVASTGYLLHFMLGLTAWKLLPLFERFGPAASARAMSILLLLMFATNYWNLGGSLQAGWLFLLFCFLVPCRPPRFKIFLLSRPLQFLGKVSFSFYALHWPVMLLLFSYMQENFSPNFPRGVFSKSILLFVTSTAASILLASLTERFVERPFNRLGHLLAGCWVRRLSTAKI